ncbi:SAM-dependent methyltransferase [Streptomyces sodiiphilus]|uniref:SAM-dependent methyltransferase n=1 Tax=Streptomyces sodiiphilus TaxID=226217 RepID=A0ABN2PXL1_9ACTN
MERPAWAPHGIDLSVPSVSRMYDYYLGGSHNFEVDRAAARQAIAAFPGLPKIMQTNRAFMRRAVRFALGEGVTQFLDIGSGIPTFGNVHEVAQAASDEARVVYVDNDPVAVAHSRAVLEGDERTAVLAADFRSPRQIVEAPETRGLLDFDRPVALLLVALLHFIEDKDDPWGSLAVLRDALPAGSLLVINHASVDGGTVPAERGENVSSVYRNAGSNLIMRSRAEVERFFDDFRLVEPGLVAAPNWRPDGPVGQEDPVVFNGLAGVGRKA